MKKYFKKLANGTLALTVAAVALVSCDKENQNDLPGTSPADFGDKIDGYDNSEQIYTQNLKAYWSFDNTKVEQKSGVDATASLNDTYVPGVRGNGIALNDGWIFYDNQFSAFKTDSLKSWTVSLWVNVLNNGSTPTMFFSLTREGQLFGNINSFAETGQNPASELNKIIIKAVFADLNGGTQDNLNAPWLPTFKSPTTGPDKWIHVVTTYDYVANNIQIWADGEMIGTTDYQNRGTNTFKATEPSKVVFGAWYTNIPASGLTPDGWQVPMKGKIDEVRIYNAILGAAHIKALYKLGLAGK